MNKNLMNSLVTVVGGALIIGVVRDSAHIDAKEHAHQETHVPAYPLTNGSFVITSTSTSLQ